MLAPGLVFGLTYKKFSVERVGEWDVLCDSYVVQKGDALMEVFSLRGQIAYRALPEFIRIFRALNPQVEDINRIFEGQTILIPLKKVPPGVLEGSESGFVSMPFVTIGQSEAPLPVAEEGFSSAAAPAPMAETYKVSSGDTVSRILMQRFGDFRSPEYKWALEEFARLNPIVEDQNRIYIGETLWLPTREALEKAIEEAAALAGSEAVVEDAAAYTVRPGDTVSRILARRFGQVGSPAFEQGMERFRELNPEITNINRIFVGDTLYLPDEEALLAMVTESGQPEPAPEEEDPVEEEPSVDPEPVRLPLSDPILEPAAASPVVEQARPEPVQAPEAPKPEPAPEPAPVLETKPEPAPVVAAAPPRQPEPKPVKVPEPEPEEMAAPGPKVVEAAPVPVKPLPKAPAVMGKPPWPVAVEPKKEPEEKAVEPVPDPEPVRVAMVEKAPEPPEPDPEPEPEPEPMEKQEVVVAPKPEPEPAAETPKPVDAQKEEKPPAAAKPPEIPKEMPEPPAPKAVKPEPAPKPLAPEKKEPEESAVAASKPAPAHKPVADTPPPAPVLVLKSKKAATRRPGRALALHELPRETPRVAVLKTLPSAEPEKRAVAQQPRVIPVIPPQESQQAKPEPRTAPKAAYTPKAPEIVQPAPKAVYAPKAPEIVQPAPAPKVPEKTTVAQTPGPVEEPPAREIAAAPARAPRIVESKPGPAVSLPFGQAPAPEAPPAPAATQTPPQRAPVAAVRPSPGNASTRAPSTGSAAVGASGNASQTKTLAQVLEYLDARIMDSGKYYFPRPGGADVELDLTRNPVVLLPDKKRVVISLGQGINTQQRMAMEAFWGPVAAVVVPEDASPQHMLGAILAGAGIDAGQREALYHDGSVGILVRGQLLLPGGLSSRVVAVTWVEKPSQATPQAVRKYLAGRNIRVVDLVSGGREQIRAEEKRLDTVSLDSLPKQDIVSQLLSELDILYARDVPISFPYAGFTMKMLTNMAKTHAGKEVIVDFGGVGGQSDKVFASIGLPSVRLEDAVGCLDLVRRLARGLDLEVEENPVWETADRPRSTTCSIKVPGILIQPQEGRALLCTTAALDENLVRFLNTKEVRVARLPGNRCP